LACCGVDGLNATVIKLGRFERHEMLALSKPGSHLSPKATERARYIIEKIIEINIPVICIFLESYLLMEKIWLTATHSMRA